MLCISDEIIGKENISLSTLNYCQTPVNCYAELSLVEAL
jgi:hypothetical protein